MNVWKITAPETLVKTEAQPAPAEGKLRVRVKKVLMCGVDADLYHGKLKARYPLVPGRFAVGVVADEGNELMPKGTRVLLNTFRPDPYTGTTKKDFSTDEYGVCGQTRDGFLSDFVSVSPDEVTPLPDSVADERALVAHYVALGKAAIDKLGVQRGQHIAVVGANLFGIIICQLLIYQQAAPILIDSNEDHLEFARKCGVYYTVAANEGMLDAVASITGGRLAAGAIYVTGAAGNDHDVPFRVCTWEANTALCGLIPGSVNFNLDIALKKQASVHCVWMCADYIESAINLIANRAVNLAAFSPVAIPVANLEEFLKSYTDEDVSKLNIVNLF